MHHALTQFALFSRVISVVAWNAKEVVDLIAVQYTYNNIQNIVTK